jgi:hypothetical protein
MDGAGACASQRHSTPARMDPQPGVAAMTQAAHISFAEMTSLMRQMPSYETYRTGEEAENAERIFRQALGRMLKECGDQLLTVLEGKSQLLSAEQRQTIGMLVDSIAAIFRRLNREGVICLVGDCEDTIAELEEIDTRLILLVEEALNLVQSLHRIVPSSGWFKREAGLLSRDLAAFSEAAEERNYLLGLGWESEFRWAPRG